MKTATRGRASIDGGARGNPGAAGCGVVLENGGHREEHTLFLGTATNNVAEYAALLAALERAHALGWDELDVRSDSQLLVEQMNGRYRVRAPHLKPLWRRARTLTAGLRRFSIAHVAREGNRDADALANRAIDEKVSTLPRPEGL
jgi:ribonuclease HI